MHPSSLRRSYWKGRTLVRRLRRAIREPMPAIEAELRRPWLRAYELATIIDVGANTGQFASWAREAFPRAQIYSFEPLPDCVRELRRRFAGDPRFEAFACALGSSAETAVMFHNEYSPASSLFPMADAHHAAFPFAARATQVAVEIRTLDDVLGARVLAAPVLLKVDVQGYEARVLAGGEATLRQCQLVMLELSLEHLYHGEPSFDEMYRTMRERGYELRAILDTLRRPSDERPVQVDAMFERRDQR